MLINIGQQENRTEIGGKAAELSHLQKNGFQIPPGIVLPRHCWRMLLEHNDADTRIAAILSSTDTPDQKSRLLRRLILTLKLPDTISAAISTYIDPSKSYAIRSSGMLEDMAEFSFAGQYDTFLQVTGLEEIQIALLKCYASLYSKTVLTYVQNNGLDIQSLDLAVIIQEMVPAEKSGVAFTMNPVTGADTQMLVEVVEGLGESLVNGQKNPDRYTFDWAKKSAFSKDTKDQSPTLPPNSILNTNEKEILKEQVIKIALLYGHPCDIEFAFSAGKLFILQCRPVTRFGYSSLDDIWTTADFKDGGVSASTCLPFMWSLYEYAFDYSLHDFLQSSYMLPSSEIRKPSQIFYGRPYWNLSVAKNAMSRVPGFKEREFDHEFGISINYIGDGRTTQITPKSLIHIARVAMKQMKLLKSRETKLTNIHKSLLEKTLQYRAQLEENYSLDDLEKLCYQLTKNDYFNSETTYFTQIFLNTVHQAIFKDSILRYADMSQYLNLISGLDHLSHLLPFYALWEISREIRKDKDAYQYWTTSHIKKILEDYAAHQTKYQMNQVWDVILRYGYHSDKELDISYPCFDENPESILKQLVQTVQLEDRYGPQKDRETQNQRYNEALKNLSQKVSTRKYTRLKRKIEKMRKLLWWREELRDVSTRYYHLIRRYLFQLAEKYHQEEILQQKDDIWYIKVEDLWDYIDRKTSPEELRAIVRQGRLYYDCYRNYMSENEIGMSGQSVTKSQKTGQLIGTGCNPGIVTGIARVVDSLENIGCLQKDDILVARFTDTGWTSQFALLKGIITEFGGMLCHSAIVSREYGIPCIVGVENALTHIPDGAQITIDGASGQILIEKQ